MLTAAGAAATGIAGAASAGLVNVTDQVDRWAGEHYWQMTSSLGSLVVSVTQLTYNGSFAYWSYVTNTVSSIWGSVFLGVELNASTTYTVTMQDTYGDGWAWGSFVGGVYVSSAGGMSAGASMPGASGSFSFHVLPAPSALALLGLAGFAGRRRK